MVCPQQHLLAQPGMTWPGRSRVPRAPPNSSSVPLEDGGVPLTAWMECKVPPDSSSVPPKDGGPSLPGQGVKHPKTPAVCIRKTGSPPLPEQAREKSGGRQ